MTRTRVKSLLNGNRTAVVLVLALVAFAPGLQAQGQIDLATEISASTASAAPGEMVTYTVDYSNLSGTAPFQAVANLNFPPVYGFDWDQATADAVEASFTDTNGNLYGLFISSSCESLLIQMQGENTGISLPANSTGTFTVDMPMASEAGVTGVVRVDSPSELAGDLAFGVGSCDDCSQDDDGNFLTCFGPRIPFYEGESLEMAVADDGTANPTLGCEAFVNDMTGKIALVRRGTCQFGLKAFNAEAAGARAVVIMNNTPGTPGMLGGDFGALVTVPVVMIDQMVGDALEAAIADGQTVMGTIGGIETAGYTFQSEIFHTSNSSETDPDATNDTDSVTVTLSSGGPDAPVAGFTYAPAAPAVGETVTFTDASTNSPTSWAWDFGDGATSTEQNPTHAYAAAGTYTVSLTATTAGGSGSASMDVTVTGGGGEPTLDKFYFVPAAAFAAGAAGSFFVTDLDVNNAGATTASYKFLWLPRGADNSSPAASELFTLGGGVSVRYANVLSEVFGAAEGAVGALAIISDSADLLFMSRTFNQGDEGTFGQAIPGYAMMDLIPANTRARILFMTENDEYRSNLGLMNGTGDPITVMWERFTADGTSLGTGSRDLPAWGNVQINRVFNDVAPVEAAYVDVWTENTGAYFGAYGSVLDATTSDPTTVLPQ